MAFAPQADHRMIISAALAAFCLLLAALSWQLSPTAGQLPAVVALLTAVPALLQLRLDSRKPTPAPAASPSWLSCLALLGGLYLTGFWIALPLYAAWSWHDRPRTAAFATAFVWTALALLHTRFDLYPGILWLR